MTEESHHIPSFRSHLLEKKLSTEKLHEGIIVVGEGDDEQDNASDDTKDYAKEIMTHLRKNDVTVYSNRMYSEKDGSAHIPIKHADSYDQDVVDELNKQGQKIRKIISKGGFSEFDTKFEQDKIIDGSTVWLSVSPK